MGISCTHTLSLTYENAKFPSTPLCAFEIPFLTHHALEIPPTPHTAFENTEGPELVEGEIPPNH